MEVHYLEALVGKATFVDTLRELAKDILYSCYHGISSGTRANLLHRPCEA